MSSTTTSAPVLDSACDGPCGGWFAAADLLRRGDATICEPCNDGELAEMAAACGVRLVSAPAPAPARSLDPAYLACVREGEIRGSRLDRYFARLDPND